MAKVTAKKILEIARKEIGTKATAVKKCKYNTWYYGSAVSGSCYDWCAVFICWLFAQAGASDLIPVRSAGCGVLASGFNNKGQFYTSNYKPGDIVFFSWSGEPSTVVKGAKTLDHVGIIEKVNSDGTFTTIEGNTGNSAYGEVMRRTRTASVISGVARPAYSGTSSTSNTTTSSGNSSIKNAQNWLNSGYKAGLTVDGVYGAKTKKALVKALQAELNSKYKAGLVVDGIFGAKTKSAVRNLSQGASGNLVKVLQGLLICNGYALVLDGIFGSGTKSAVKSYQSKKKLTADGIAGKQTFSALCN